MSLVKLDPKRYEDFVDYDLSKTLESRVVDGSVKLKTVTDMASAIPKAVQRKDEADQGRLEQINANRELQAAHIKDKQTASEQAVMLYQAENANLRTRIQTLKDSSTSKDENMSRMSAIISHQGQQIKTLSVQRDTALRGGGMEMSDLSSGSYVWLYVFITICILCVIVWLVLSFCDVSSWYQGIPIAIIVTIFGAYMWMTTRRKQPKSHQ